MFTLSRISDPSDVIATFKHVDDAVLATRALRVEHFARQVPDVSVEPFEYQLCAGTEAEACALEAEARQPRRASPVSRGLRILHPAGDVECEFADHALAALQMVYRGAEVAIEVTDAETGTVSQLYVTVSMEGTLRYTHAPHRAPLNDLRGALQALGYREPALPWDRPAVDGPAADRR
jgi:hypothetical protein